MATSSSQSDSNPLTETDKTAAVTTEPSPTAAESSSPAENTTESSAFSLDQSWLYAGGVCAAVYGLFASIDLLNIGFQSILGPQINGLLDLAANPWLGLLLGILTTALMQSSSIVTTLLVALVAGGLPIATAIPIVMGANLGTTITNTLVSLGYVSNDEDFERGFAAATIHDCFNLIALLIFFPLELFLHPLQRFSQWILQQGLTLTFISDGFVSPVEWSLQPIRWLMSYGVNALPGPWDSLLLFSSSVGGLMISVTILGWLLKHWLGGPAQTAIRWAVGHGSSLGGLAAGASITALLQSSSMTTSLMVPLAGAGLVTLEEVYPFVLGANIGTCITALLATLAVNSPVALQLALIHLGYNLFAVILIYGLPVLRSVPITMASKLASVTLSFRLVSIVYVVGLFFALPFLTLWISLTLMV